MPRFVAFLRAVNVGKRTAPMAMVRQALEALGFTAVATMLNSGNVSFESPDADAADIERRIEGALRDQLGFDVETFVRTPRQLAAIAERDAFGGVPIGAGDTVQVGFLRRQPAATVRRAIEAMSNDTDLLRVHGRELYWLIHGKMMDSALPAGGFERALGGPTATTLRNIKTIHRLVARHPP